VITNERQYKITNSQLAKLREGVSEFDLEEVANRLRSKALAKAELDGLKSEIEILESQLQEYENLKTGVVTNFKANTLDELPIVLIQARIAQKLSQRELGELIGVQEQQIQRYESDKYASANLRRIQEIANALKLNIAEIAEINKTIKLKTGVEKSNVIEWNRFPAKEMYKRGWFEGFSGSLKDLTEEADELVAHFILNYTKKPSLTLHHKMIRSGSQIDLYALLAWECRIRALASKIEVIRKFNPKLLTADWIEDFKRLSMHSDGPIQAKAMLNEVGIRLIIEPHLPNTYLDGAAMLLNGKTPIIGLTLRHDRIDNFWFVLFHEFIHVKNHLEKGKIENIFDDLPPDTETSSENDVEKEADQLANEILIPTTEWEKALPRYVRSTESILGFASQLKISPAIVAGRIRREANNYTMFNNLIGQGEVRKQFTDVDFWA